MYLDKNKRFVFFYFYKKISFYTQTQHDTGIDYHLNILDYWRYFLATTNVAIKLVCGSVFMNIILIW